MHNIAWDELRPDPPSSRPMLPSHEHIWQHWGTFYLKCWLCPKVIVCVGQEKAPDTDESEVRGIGDEPIFIAWQLG